MDGYKNTTRTVYLSGGGAVKGDAGAAKMNKVMHEFKTGKLHSGDKEGPKVTSRKQAVAIAMSEAGKAKAPVKKADGGLIGKLASSGMLGLAGLAASNQGQDDSAANASAQLLADTNRRKQLAAEALARSAPVARAKGGTIDRNMIESTSTRPTPIKGGDPAMRAIVERGNRNQALEAADEGVMPRAARRGVPVAPREPLIQKARGGLAVMPRGKC